jgi:pimeloyl-ACP methyl ester carboxylesterase
MTTIASLRRGVDEGESCIWDASKSLGPNPSSKFLPMARRRPLGKKLFKSLLPILLVLALALVIALGFIVYGITRPPKRAYLVTPQTFTGISGRVLKVSDASWQNRDGTRSRGWLLKGSEGAPAVVFLHKYGGDRSALFNLGIKLNEATNFTILWPDLRGHGVAPSIPSTSFGVYETEDLLAALDFLRAEKGENQNTLVGNTIGLYGVELGAYAALQAATKDPGIKALVLDSVPRDADDLIDGAVREDVGFNSDLVSKLTRTATHTYFMGNFQNPLSCELAKSLGSQRVLLLAGSDAEHLRQTTVAFQNCFPNPANLEVKTDLPLTGFTLPSATGEQGERYDRPVIEFFTKSMR